MKILDFGLARLVTSELTRSNMMMGTINYMSPEQIRGEQVDHRADIFSTAVVLYELLSGTPCVRRRFVRRDALQDPAGISRSRCSRSIPRFRSSSSGSSNARWPSRATSGISTWARCCCDLAVLSAAARGHGFTAGGPHRPDGLRTPSDRLFPVTPPIPLPPVATPLPGAGRRRRHRSLASSPPAPAGIRSYLLPAIAVLALAIAAIAMWNSSRSPLDAPEPRSRPPLRPSRHDQRSDEDAR